MDPLSVTASVIAVTTLAYQSCQTARRLVDGLVDAPQAISRSRAALGETLKTLVALQEAFQPASGSALEHILRTINLDGALVSTRQLCDELATAIQALTTHSTESKFSKRDRVTVSLHESKIGRINRDLGDCQRTLSMVLVSINLIVTARTGDDIQRLGDRFRAQEVALANLDMQLDRRQSSPGLEEDLAADRDGPLQLTAELRQVCREALPALRQKRTGQQFGDMITDDQSLAMQGIVGEAQDGVEQSFQKMTTSKNSRAFQGQMDATSFAAMFGR